MTTISPSPDITQLGTLYTIGYSNQADRQRLEQLMHDHRRRLSDIRFAPRSRAYPEFGRKQLHARFNVQEQASLPVAERRVRYVWYQALGNRNYATGIPHVVAHLIAGRDVILLCACANARHCHRTLVAKLVQEQLAALP